MKNKFKIAAIVTVTLFAMLAYKKWWENKEKNNSQPPEPESEKKKNKFNWN